MSSELRVRAIIQRSSFFNNVNSELEARPSKLKLKNMFGINKENAQGQVTELVEKLKSQAGLNDEQAKKVIETIKDFVVDKYPMLSGAVNNIFGNK